MRRNIPFLILGVLTVGTVIGLVLGLASSNSPTPPATSSSAATVPTTEANGSNSTTTLPVGRPVTVEACGLVTASESKSLLNQIVNQPPLAKTPFCQYEGIVTVPPSTRPPALSVTAVSDPKTLASAENILANNVTAVCGTEKNPACSNVLKLNRHTTVDGVPVVWRQSITTIDGYVGSAYAVKDGTVIVITVSGVNNAAPLALKAMADALPRL